MRTIRLVASTIVALSMSIVAAQADGAWCANYGSHGGVNCGFHSFEQCRATVSGIGGFCSPNPFSANTARETRTRYRRNQ